MTMKSYITYASGLHYPESRFEVVEFPHRDAKGRQIGARIERYEGEFVAEPQREYQGWHSDKWLGPVFVACVMTTRNGERYGASQSRSHFRTEAEREAFVAKRLKASEKAAAKKGQASA